MSAIEYSAATVDDLLKAFERSCLIQDETLLDDDIKKYNEEYWNLVAIKDELKRRGAEARRSLLQLFSHENAQVRLQAATFVYPVARAEAKACLAAIKAMNVPDQSLDAGMTLWSLSERPNCLDD